MITIKVLRPSVSKKTSHRRSHNPPLLAGSLQLHMLVWIVKAYLGLNGDMAISRVVGSLAVLPAAIAWSLRATLPTPVTLVLVHIAVTGFTVSAAATDVAAKKTTGLLGKSNDGKVGLWSSLVFWPYHVGLQAKLIWRRLSSSEPLYHEILPGWFLGGWPKNAKQLPPGNPAVVDVTCELPRNHSVGPYLCLPTWDTHAPTPKMIEDAVDWAVEQYELDKPVYIHCAHGHGRSATVLCACLIQTGKVSDIQEAISMLQKVRPKVKMNTRQRSELRNWITHRTQNGQSTS